jgi:hypothetical protein
MTETSTSVWVCLWCHNSIISERFGSALVGWLWYLMWEAQQYEDSASLYDSSWFKENAGNLMLNIVLSSISRELLVYRQDHEHCDWHGQSTQYRHWSWTTTQGREPVIRLVCSVKIGHKLTPTKVKQVAILEICFGWNFVGGDWDFDSLTDQYLEPRPKQQLRRTAGNSESIGHRSRTTSAVVGRILLAMKKMLNSQMGQDVLKFYAHNKKRS